MIHGTSPSSFESSKTPVRIDRRSRTEGARGVTSRGTTLLGCGLPDGDASISRLFRPWEPPIRTYLRRESPAFFGRPLGGAFRIVSAPGSHHPRIAHVVMRTLPRHRGLPVVHGQRRVFGLSTCGGASAATGESGKAAPARCRDGGTSCRTLQPEHRRDPDEAMLAGVSCTMGWRVGAACLEGGHEDRAPWIDARRVQGERPPTGGQVYLGRRGRRPAGMAGA